MTSTPTAYWPLDHLVLSLRSEGWGPLAGAANRGLQSTLDALVATLPHKSAAGPATAAALADKATLSERWVRRCLGILEDLGVIIWRRGGVIRGQTVPSFIKVVKSALVRLIKAARPQRSRRIEKHRAAVAAKLAHVRKPKGPGHYIPRHQAEKAELQAELSSPLPLKREVLPATAAGSTTSLKRVFPAKKKAGKKMTPSIPPLEQIDRSRLPKVCPHGFSVPCLACRYEAMTPEQMAEYQAERIAETNPPTPAPAPLTTAEREEMGVDDSVEGIDLFKQVMKNLGLAR